MVYSTKTTAIIEHIIYDEMDDHYGAEPEYPWNPKNQHSKEAQNTDDNRFGKLPAVSAFVAVTALVPIFGAWIGGGFGAFLIMLAKPGKALWFILFLIVLQQVEGNLIYPKVVGKSVGLPGLLVLMAVTIGGEAFGILGMLFSVPVCAVLFSLYLEFMKKASPL